MISSKASEARGARLATRALQLPVAAEQEPVDGGLELAAADAGALERPPDEIADVRAGADREAADRSRVGDDAMVVLAVLFGAGSLALFAAWPFDVVRLGLGERATLVWDGVLSVAFFLQHSVMVRAPVKRRLGRLVPERYVAAIYAISSGVVLTLVLVLWQRSPVVALVVDGPLRWLLRALGLAGVAGLLWGVLSLRGFDPLGLGPIRAHWRGEPYLDYRRKVPMLVPWHGPRA